MFSVSVVVQYSMLLREIFVLVYTHSPMTKALMRGGNGGYKGLKINGCIGVCSVIFPID